MTEAGCYKDAETDTANLVTALNQAMQISSPSKRWMLPGTGTLEGIGPGMMDLSRTSRAFERMADFVQRKIEKVLTP